MVNPPGPHETHSSFLLYFSFRSRYAWQRWRFSNCFLLSVLVNHRLWPVPTYKRLRRTLYPIPSRAPCCGGPTATTLRFSWDVSEVRSLTANVLCSGCEVLVRGKTKASLEDWLQVWTGLAWRVNFWTEKNGGRQKFSLGLRDGRIREMVRERAREEELQDTQQHTTTWRITAQHNTTMPLALYVTAIDQFHAWVNIHPPTRHPSTHSPVPRACTMYRVLCPVSWCSPIPSIFPSIFRLTVS
jgi:hypothetical protein